MSVEGEGGRTVDEPTTGSPASATGPSEPQRLVTPSPTASTGGEGPGPGPRSATRLRRPRGPRCRRATPCRLAFLSHGPTPGGPRAAAAAEGEVGAVEGEVGTVSVAMKVEVVLAAGVTMAEEGLSGGTRTLSLIGGCYDSRTRRSHSPRILRTRLTPAPHPPLHLSPFLGPPPDPPPQPISFLLQTFTSCERNSLHTILPTI